MDYTGRLALSTAGRDKGTVLCVLERQGDFVLLADGKSRRVQKPKRKKLKHIVLLENAAVYGGPMTNKAIHAFIRDNACGQSCDGFNGGICSG